MNNESLETHLLNGGQLRAIKTEGRSLILHHCARCGRDFAQEPGKSNWRAIRVGAFRVDFLADDLSQQWVSEPCPGSPSPTSIAPMPWHSRMVQRCP